MSIRTTNPEVPYYWSRHKAARSGNNQYWTDGQVLYSYSKVIGVTLRNGDKVLLDYTAPAGHMISMTTSNHVGKARRYADAIMDPDVALTGGIITRRQRS